MTTRQLARLLRKSHRLTRSWAETANAFGITKALAYRIAREKYDPADPGIRARLGLGPRPCPTCHRTVRAPKTQANAHARTHARIADTPPAVLKWQLENRVPMEEVDPKILKQFVRLGWIAENWVAS